MSKPIAVPARPGLSHAPTLASADDAVPSQPVSPRPARCDVSWSQSRSQGLDGGQRSGLTPAIPCMPVNEARIEAGQMTSHTPENGHSQEQTHGSVSGTLPARPPVYSFRPGPRSTTGSVYVP